MLLSCVMNNLPFGNKNKTNTQHQLEKHGPGFSQIPVFVPADIEKSKDKERKEDK